MRKIKEVIIFTLLRFAKGFRTVLSESEDSYKLLFLPGYERTRWQIGKWKAWRVFVQAQKFTPAYKEFLGKNGNFVIPVKGWDPDLSVVPIMDKESYIKKFSIESRCLYGAFPNQALS